VTNSNPTFRSGVASSIVFAVLTVHSSLSLTWQIFLPRCMYLMVLFMSLFGDEACYGQCFGEFVQSRFFRLKDVYWVQVMDEPLDLALDL